MEKTLVKNDIFYCYSPNVQKYLVANGFSVIDCGVHKVTKRVFLCFEKSKKLDQYLLIWKNRRKLVS